MFFRKCLHNATNFSKIFPRIASQQSELESHTTVVINFFRASNCLLEIFSSSCAVFLGFYNVSIFCHLTVKACQIISDFLAVCLNELETSLFWVFIVFGSWQITRNATKSESVALKRTNLAVFESWNFSSSFRFVPSHSARSLSGVIKLGYSCTSAGQPDFIPSVAAVYNSYRHFSRPTGGRFSFNIS